MANAGRGVPPQLHAVEAEIMELIWRRNPTTVRDVLDALNASSAQERAYTTVMTVMARLDRKGLLARRREGKCDVYAPVFSRERYLELRARAEVGELVEQYGEAALLNFARHMNELDPKRREQLRRLARRD